MSLQNYFFPRKSFNPNLLILPRPCCFSLNNSETVKAVTVTFCSPQYHFIRDICARFDISNSSQSPDIWWNSDGGISYFQISGQSFINKNCHNSRISHDNDIKLGPVTKLDTRNTTTSKKLTITSCQKFVMSLSYFRFMANLHFHEIVNFYLTKTENRTKKSLTQLWSYCCQ